MAGADRSDRDVQRHDAAGQVRGRQERVFVLGERVRAAKREQDEGGWKSKGLKDVDRARKSQGQQGWWSPAESGQTT